jgi:hypothetical protein
VKERINPVGGEAAGIIAKARAERWHLENTAHGEAVLFRAMAAVKKVAPKTFFLREKLKAFGEAMGGIRKYVIAAEGKVDVKTFHLNLQDPVNAPLDFKAGSE